MISKTASIKSIPYTTKPLAIANRINSFKADSGLLISVRFAQDFATPYTKKRTKSANPIARSASWIFTMICQIPPPLKF